MATLGTRGSGLGARDSALRLAAIAARSGQSREGSPPGLEAVVKNICWTLIGLGALAFLFGTYTAFTGQNFLLAPQGYWRGAVGFAVFAIALRLMDDPRK